MAAAVTNNNIICILYADDEPMNRKIFAKNIANRLTDYINNHGVISQEVEDGSEVIPFIESHSNYRFIIVLDEEMGHMDGSQTAQKIREMGLKYFIFGYSSNEERHNKNLSSTSSLEEFDSLSQLSLLPPDNMPGLISQSITPTDSRSSSISSISSVSPEFEPRKSFFGSLFSLFSKKSSQVQSYEMSLPASARSASSSVISTTVSSSASTRRNSIEMPLFNQCFQKPSRELYEKLEEILKKRFYKQDS